MDIQAYTQDGSVTLYGRPANPQKTGSWRACGFLLAYETLERLAFYGVASNLVGYLTMELHEDTFASVRNVNIWHGAIWITPLFGAYIADTYLGRFWTFSFGSLIHLLGMVILSLGVIFKQVLFPSDCTDVIGSVCSSAPKDKVALFYASLYIIAFGIGGTKPNISTFGADQFDDFNPHESKLKSSFFNWWFFSTFLGAFLASIPVFLQENTGWELGYGIPTIALSVSLIIFYLGVPLYRHKPKRHEHPISEVFSVFKKAIVNHCKVSNESMTRHELENQNSLTSSKRQLHHTSCFKFLDKAAIKECTNPCTVTQVESAKLFLKMFLIWVTALIPYTILSQTNTLYIKQGYTLDRSLGPDFQIPAATLSGFMVLTLCILVPIYDRVFVPMMRSCTKDPRGITMLQRIGVGFFLVIVNMVVAYIVERKRMAIIEREGLQDSNEMVPMSILWLVPQYIIIGISDVFSAIGLLEFFYDQCPDGMLSLATAFFTSGFGVGNFVNCVLVTVVNDMTTRNGGKSWIGDNLNDTRLDNYFLLLIVLSVLNFVLFLWGTRGYQYKNEVEIETIEVDEEAKKIEGNNHC